MNLSLLIFFVVLFTLVILPLVVVSEACRQLVVVVSAISVGWYVMPCQLSMLGNRDYFIIYFVGSTQRMLREYQRNF